MFFEQDLVAAGRRMEATRAKARHDLADDGSVIFRFDLVIRAFDAELREILAKPRQRPLVNESR